MAVRKSWSREQIAEYWYGRDVRITAHTIACWCCGRLDVRLDRAHIVPLCEGGTDSVDNIHLLCSSCHRDTEFLSGDDYWAYLRSFPYMFKRMSALKILALRSAGVVLSGVELEDCLVLLREANNEERLFLDLREVPADS